MRSIATLWDFAGSRATMTDDSFWRQAVDAASRRYPGADRHARRFARAKLSHDRVFRHIFQQGLVPAGARVLDVGCGQGLFACVLHTLQQAAQRGKWPAGWAAPPSGARVLGIDPLRHDVERARAALGPEATFTCADMRRFAFPPSDVVLFLDTLHYIVPVEQVAVLAAGWRLRSARRVHARGLARAAAGARAGGADIAAERPRASPQPAAGGAPARAGHGAGYRGP